MEQLLMQMVESAKKDKKAIISLKNLAVKLQQFELSVAIREIERDLFPETEETKAAKTRAKNLKTAFSMADLQVPEDVCWMVDEIIKAVNKKKGKFDLDTATKLRWKSKEIFTLVE